MSMKIEEQLNSSFLVQISSTLEVCIASALPKNIDHFS